MAPSGYHQYGRRFLDTFDRHWAASIELQVWTEEPYRMPRDACRDLWSIPGAREIHARYGQWPDAQGRVPTPKWKASAKAKGYNFRFDAYKFWKQILIPEAASRDMADGDILIWLDADVVSLAPISEAWIENLIGDADVCYLGRERSHSEIGFWAVQLTWQTRRFLTRIAEMYTTDAVFGLTEWHSAFVWDHVRREMTMKERNMTPRGNGHVWHKSPLAAVSDHLKGARKGLARSPEARR